MRLRRPLPAVQGDTLHIVGVGDNRIGKEECDTENDKVCFFLKSLVDVLSRYFTDLKEQVFV